MSLAERTYLPYRLPCSLPQTEEEAVRCYHAYLIAESERDADALLTCLIGEMDEKRPVGVFANTILRVVQSQLRGQSQARVDSSDLCFNALAALLDTMKKRRENLLRFDASDIKKPLELLMALSSRSDSVSQRLWRRLPVATKMQVKTLSAAGAVPGEIVAQLAALLTLCLSDIEIPSLCETMAREATATGDSTGVALKQEIDAVLSGLKGVPQGRRLAHGNRRLLGILYREMLKSQSDNIIFYGRTVTRNGCIRAFALDKQQSPAVSSLDDRSAGDGPAIEVADPDSDPYAVLIQHQTERQREVEANARYVAVRAYFVALWQALQQRTPRQCAAVTLGLGSAVLRWWPPLGVASLRQIAEQIGVEPYAVSVALKAPKLNDLEIARVIGLYPPPPRTVEQIEGLSAEEIRKLEKEAELKINSARLEAFEKLFECRELLSDTTFLRLLYFCLMGLKPTLEEGWDRSYAVFVLHHQYKRFSIVERLLDAKVLSLATLRAAPYLADMETLQTHLPLSLEAIGPVVASEPKTLQAAYARLHKMLKTELKRNIHRLTLPGRERSESHEPTGIRTSHAGAA